jgi:hypothetical protein
MHEKYSRRWFLSSVISITSLFWNSTATAQVKVRRVRNQYIASLGGPDATSGTGAETWGIWEEDPGPKGVWLRFYKLLRKAGNLAPNGWRFDIDDWWLDENGLLMKAPKFPIPPGRYYVTNGEEHISLLTIEKPDHLGQQRWKLSDGKTIANVTHGPCRSARYTPQHGSGSCTPQDISLEQFPLELGQQLPNVQNCDKMNYSVLIVFAFPVDS